MINTFPIKTDGLINQILRILPLPDLLDASNLSSIDKSTLISYFIESKITETDIEETSDLIKEFATYKSLSFKGDQKKQTIRFLTEFLLMYEQILKDYINHYSSKCNSITVGTDNGTIDLVNLSSENKFSQEYHTQLKHCWAKLAVHIFDFFRNQKIRNTSEFMDFFNELMQDFARTINFNSVNDTLQKIESLYITYVQNKKIENEVKKDPERFIYNFSFDDVYKGIDINLPRVQINHDGEVCTGH